MNFATFKQISLWKTSTQQWQYIGKASFVRERAVPIDYCSRPTALVRIYRQEAQQENLIAAVWQGFPIPGSHPRLC